MTERRPDPDALLAHVRDEEARRARGKLKVFFGAAAGVGKTYAMLETARAQRAAGVDVVAGVVETHHRAETEALLDGIEILPRRRIEHRGTLLEEFDLDAALARHELALRHTAERVDAKMQRYRREHAIGPVWPVAERVLVCVGPSPLSARLVRAGRRLAAQLEAPWVVAYVETPAHRSLGDEDRARVAQTLRLAESLGAETITLTGTRMSDEILAYAGTRNVSKIAIGKPTRGFWRRVFFGSIVDALVRGSGEIDIYVISGDGTPPPTPRRRVRPRASEPVPYAAALATALASTALAWLMFPRFELSNIIMVYLLGVVIVAMRFGRVASALASVLSVAAFDFFFVPPLLTFAVSDTQYLITFAIMLVVGLVISDLTARTRDAAEGARAQERRTATLYSLSRELAAAREIAPLLAAAV